MEFSDVHQEVETKFLDNFRFRSYGGKTFPGCSKLVEGAQIAHKLSNQNFRAPHVTFRTENRMSAALPVPELWRENTSGLAKLVEKAQIAQKLL
jgi:hypothetical protein